MLWEHAIALRDRAAAKTVERIRADHKSASWRIRPLLQHIEEHLFDPDLDVNRLRRDLGVRNNSTMTVFHQEVGLPPKAYMVDCRMEIATRLLRDTVLRIWKISDLIGYSSMPVFSQAFTQWAGIPPTKYRQRIQSPACRRFRDRWNRSPFLRQALRGELETEDSDPLLRYLDSLYRKTSSPNASMASDIEQIIAMDGMQYDQLRARRVWEYIGEWPLEKQRHYLRYSVTFGSRELFDLLRLKSREIGRQDRQRGVEIAELALESVIASGERLKEQLPNLLAQAWAWIGNARRLAFDFPGAEEALLTAEEYWHQRRTLYDHMVKAEILSIKSCQRLFQGEFPEALALIDQALAICRRSDNLVMLTRVLIHRATVLTWDGKPHQAVPDLNEARVLVANHPDQERLLLAIDGNRATLFAYIGQHQAAFQALQKAKHLCRDFGDELVQCQLRWTEGIIYTGMEKFDQAEQLFRSAREHFIALGSGGHVTMVTLDLALLYEKQQRLDEIIPLVVAIIPIFESFRFQKKTLGTLQLLRQAVRDKAITSSLLEELRLVCLRHTLVTGQIGDGDGASPSP